jgi:ABC-type spermidine/putrescine transport system permease subunit II
MTRSDITDWLIERTKAEQRQQAAILISAIVAAVASAVAVVIGVIALTLHK